MWSGRMQQATLATVATVATAAEAGRAGDLLQLQLHAFMRYFHQKPTKKAN